MTTRTRQMDTAHPNIRLEADPPRVRWFPEPEIRFADDLHHIDPKVGIAIVGPRSYGTTQHRPAVNVGFIGTAATVEKARTMLLTAAEGLDGDDNHTPFPGFQPDRGFRSTLATSDDLVMRISSSEQRDLLAKGRRQRDRFEELVGIIDDRLEILTERDHPLDCVVVALPTDLYKRCRVADYRDNNRSVHRDLRAAIKAVAMRHGTPTQLVREGTTDIDDGGSVHPADVAWNLFTGMYFKAGGYPWGPVGLPAGTCHIGISFYRPLGEDSMLRASVAQAFSETGDAFVLRGHEFPWQGPSPHLPADHAHDLIERTVERYRREHGRPPAHVVVHKRSWFHEEEIEALHDALRGTDLDLVSLRWAPNVRLLRHAQYPPLRGTAFTIGDRHYVYPTGTDPVEGRYRHGHVPQPLEVLHPVGDSTTDEVIGNVLRLTKMNWNSANRACREPITTRFAAEVGAVLKEVGPDRAPAASYSMYM